MSDIVMIKGDNTTFETAATRTNLDTGLEEPVDLTGGKAWFTAKRESVDEDVNAIISKNSEDNPTEVQILEGGIVRVAILPVDTIAYSHKYLLYDVQIKEADGTVSTVEHGYLELIKHSTIATI